MTGEKKAMTKVFLSIIGAIVLCALGALGMWKFGMKPPPPPAPLMKLEQMGHLVSAKIHYGNVIEFTKETAGIPWTGIHLGGAKVLLVARGDCLIGTDIRSAKYQDVNPQQSTAVLRLPQPKVISARVSHDAKENGGSYFYHTTNSGLEMFTPGTANHDEAIQAAFNLAQKDILQVCGNSETLATARENAEATLSLVFKATGWKVDIQWEK
jgi:hypothetical protein